MVGRGPGVGGQLRARGAAAGADQRSGHRPDLRRRPGRGRSLLRHRAGRRREPRRAAEARGTAGAMGSVRHRRAAVPRARARPRRADRAPGHQARQRADLEPRPGQGGRSGDRAPRRGDHRGRDSDDRRHAALHGARAGERSARLPGHRRLQRRHRAVRDARRASAVQRRDGGRDRDAPRAGAARAAAPGDATVARADRPARAGQGAGRSISERGGDGRGPRARAHACE